MAEVFDLGARIDGPRPGWVTRLKECKLGKWILAYLAAAWMVLQMTDALREIWDWPQTAPRAITLALGLGILPAAVIAWYHGEKGRQRVCLVETSLLGGMLCGSAWLIWVVCS